MLAKVANKDTQSVVSALIKQARKLPSELYKSLTWDRGEVKAHRGDPGGALADWRRAHELDPENFAPVYASAFLLEREGRLAEAAEAWRQIVDFATERGWELTAAWPRQELQRVLGLLGKGAEPSG